MGSVQSIMQKLIKSVFLKGKNALFHLRQSGVVQHGVREQHDIPSYPSSVPMSLLLNSTLPTLFKTQRRN